MKHKVVVLVKSAESLCEPGAASSGKIDPYVRLWVVDAEGKLVSKPKETQVTTGDKDPVWNEELSFGNMETPESCTLKIEVLDRACCEDPAVGAPGKLGTAEVHLGTLQKKDGWQDRELVVERSMLGAAKSTLHMALSNADHWGC